MSRSRLFIPMLVLVIGFALHGNAEDEATESNDPNPSACSEACIDAEDACYRRCPAEDTDEACTDACDRAAEACFDECEG